MNSAEANTNPDDIVTIYKMLTQSEWAQFESDGSTAGAPIDVQDGYIHFSTAGQIGETARKYFSDVDPLFVVAVPVSNVRDNLKWEPSRGGDLFPHLYAILELKHIAWANTVAKTVDGSFDFTGLQA